MNGQAPELRLFRNDSYNKNYFIIINYNNTDSEIQWSIMHTFYNIRPKTPTKHEAFFISDWYFRSTIGSLNPNSLVWRRVADGVNIIRRDGLERRHVTHARHSSEQWRVCNEECLRFTLAISFIYFMWRAVVAR